MARIYIIYIYRNALLSAIVKRLTPEGQPQLLDRGAALSVWRSFGQAGARDRRAHGSRARDGSRRGREESRSLNLPLPRPTVLTYPTVRALRLVADQKRSRVRVRPGRAKPASGARACSARSVIETHPLGIDKDRIAHFKFDVAAANNERRNVATESTWDEACRVIAEGRGGNCSERERGTLDFRDHEVQTCGRSGHPFPTRWTDEPGQHRQLVCRRLSGNRFARLFIAFWPSHFHHPSRAAGPPCRCLVARCTAHGGPSVDPDHPAVHRWRYRCPAQARIADFVRNPLEAEIVHQPVEQCCAIVTLDGSAQTLVTKFFERVE